MARSRKPGSTERSPAAPAAAAGVPPSNEGRGGLGTRVVPADQQHHQQQQQQHAAATPAVQVPGAARAAARATPRTPPPQAALLGTSLSSLSSSPLPRGFKDPPTGLTLQEKDRLVARHLVTSSRSQGGSTSPVRDSRPGSGSPNAASSSSARRGTAEAFPEEFSPDFEGEGTASTEAGEAARRIPAIAITGAKQPVADSSPDDEIFSTSHKLVGGAIVRDIYKWHEKQAAASESAKRRSRSHTDLAGLLEANAASAAGPSSLPGATAGAADMARATLSPSDAVTASSMRVPGGFRRHYVQRQAQAQGRQPLPVTKSFLDFLALYGHFAGDDFSDDDDTEGEDEEAVQVPYPQPGIPVRPGRTGERTPLIRRQASDAEVGSASAKKAVFLLLKSFIGTGVLFLPRSFYNGGMLFSIVVLIFISWLCLYAMLLLVECRTVVKGSFGDIGGALYGPKMRNLVLSSIAMSQVGFCCAYFIFVAHNMRDLVLNITDCQTNLPNSVFIMLQLVLYIPVSMIRKIHKLGFLALVADVFILMGLAYLFYYDIFVLSTTGPAPLRNVNADGVSLFIGTAIFTFEGIGLVLPIADSMREPGEFPRVLSWTMLFITVVFISAGALSYAAFGDAVETVVLLNLPPKDPLVHAIQLLYSLAIMFSVPLMLYPAVRIMEAAAWVRTGKASAAVKWQKNAFRAGLCILAALISVAGAASLDRFVALIGAFACIPLSFIYPAMFHYKAVAKSPAARCKDVALIIFGSVCMVFVAAQTLQNWIAGGDEPQMGRCA